MHDSLALGLVVAVHAICAWVVVRRVWRGRSAGPGPAQREMRPPGRRSEYEERKDLIRSLMGLERLKG